jgi:hypothetical protein
MRVEFVAGNREGSILRVIPEERRILYFRDPWGRDSSSTPDNEFVVSRDLERDPKFQRILASFSPPDRAEIAARCAAVPSVPHPGAENPPRVATQPAVPSAAPSAAPPSVEPGSAELAARARGPR